MLRVFGHPVARCCDMLGVVSSNLTIFKLSQRHPTYIACCVQQYVAFTCCDRLARALRLSKGDDQISFSKLREQLALMHMIDWTFYITHWKYLPGVFLYMIKKKPLKLFLETCLSNSWLTPSNSSAVSKQTQFVSRTTIYFQGHENDMLSSIKCLSKQPER